MPVWVTNYLQHLLQTQNKNGRVDAKSKCFQIQKLWQILNFSDNDDGDCGDSDDDNNTSLD